MNGRSNIALVATIWLLCTFLSACSNSSQTILIDGSSTVYPVSEAVAEEFLKHYPDASIAIGESGTGGGFDKFCRGETTINDASRPITSTETKQCRQNGIEFIELPVALDGIVIAVHPSNHWVNYLTVSELKKIWEPKAQGKILRWNQIRPQFPNQEIHLYGAGISSGTYDYFTEVIVGRKQASRGDYTASEDDNILVKGISTDPMALGYFGLAYYTENKDKLKALAIDDEKPENGTQPVVPSYQTIASGLYQPLTRPEFIYVRNDRTQQPAIANFVRFYLQYASQLVREVGYVPLPDQVYTLALRRFEQRQTGSVFTRNHRKDVPLEILLTTPTIHEAHTEDN